MSLTLAYMRQLHHLAVHTLYQPGHDRVPLPVHAGVWATLQFKWVQMQYPVVVLAFEKLLLGASVPVAATLQAWGLVSAVGASVAPFYLAVVLCGLYYLCALPVQSSFHQATARGKVVSCSVNNVND